MDENRSLVSVRWGLCSNTHKCLGSVPVIECFIAQQGAGEQGSKDGSREGGRLSDQVVDAVCVFALLVVDAVRFTLFLLAFTLFLLCVYAFPPRGPSRGVRCQNCIGELDKVLKTV